MVFSQKRRKRKKKIRIRKIKTRKINKRNIIEPEKKDAKGKDNIIKIINPIDYYYLQQHPELKPGDMEYNPPKKKKMRKIMIQTNINSLNINYNRKINQNIKNIVNVVILKCYNVLFSKNGLKGNYGFYITIPILVSHFIFIIIFYRN